MCFRSGYNKTLRRTNVWCETAHCLNSVLQMFRCHGATYVEQEDLIFRELLSVWLQTLFLAPWHQSVCSETGL